MHSTDHSRSGHLKVLARSDGGAVLGCHDCGALQLQYGNIVLGLTPADVDSLVSTVEGLRRQQRAGFLPTIFLTDNGFGLRLLHEEAGDLIELMRAARGLQQHDVLGELTGAPSRSPERHSH